MLISIGESDVEKVCQFVKDVVRLSPPTELQPVSLFQETVTDAGVSINLLLGEQPLHILMFLWYLLLGDQPLHILMFLLDRW